MGHLIVPRKRADFVKFRTSSTGRIRFARVFEVPDINLKKGKVESSRKGGYACTSPLIPPEANKVD
jgi:hypothetical protein